MAEPKMIEVALSRIVFRDGADRQYIFLVELEGSRGFPIVIGTNEAEEIRRVVHGNEPQRPLTHQLAYATIKALGAGIRCVDIVDLRHNTFYAHIVLQNEQGDVLTVIDARPSDAIALALRAGACIRVAEPVMERACETGGSP